MTKEIWKDIIGYKGYYQISNLGRIRSVEREVNCRNNSKRILPSKNRSLFKKENGYMSLTLQVDNKTKSFYVHRLVAEAFIPNPNLKKTVNHINEIKHDNRVENLEWATYSENLNYNNLRKRMSETRKRTAVVSKQNNPNWKDIEYYKNNPVERGSFKKCCLENKGWLIENFIEIWKGDINKRGAKKYFYIHKAFKKENYE